MGRDDLFYDCIDFEEIDQEALGGVQQIYEQTADNERGV